MHQPLPEVTLANVCRGVIPVRFGQAMDDVMENIQDLNTPHDKERKVIIELTIKPLNDDRVDLASDVVVKTKLADPTAVAGTLFVGKKDGKHVFRTSDPQQRDLWSNEDEQVTPINREEATS